MSNRHLSETKYFALLRDIRAVGGVECEKHPELFFPEDLENPERRSASIRAAIAICNVCPIKTECFTYAIETSQRYGIWGGTQGHER